MSINDKIKMRSGMFEDKDSAERAYQAALRRGYKQDDINVIMSDETRKKYYANSDEVIHTERGDKSMEGLALGGALGGTTVGVLGAVVALSTTIAIPGLGLIIAGPLAAGLVGAGAGSIAGGLLGALIGAGFDEERATIYENGIKKGGVVLTVRSNENIADDELIEDWKKSNGRDIY